MANISKRNYGFNNFDSLIDSFFNDDFPWRSPSVYDSSFKVDVSESDTGYTVEADMPGFTKDDIDIDLDEGRLTISCEKNEESDKSDESKNYVHKERRSTKLARSMYFPDIDENNIRARLENGVLTIDLPKAQVIDNKKKIEIE